MSWNKNIIPIPIGYIVGMRYYEWEGITPIRTVRKVIINKQMFPGYIYKNTDVRSMRYGVTDLEDSSRGWVIEENDIKEPDVASARLYKEDEELLRRFIKDTSNIYKKEKPKLVLKKRR